MKPLAVSDPSTAAELLQAREERAGVLRADGRARGRTDLATRHLRGVTSLLAVRADLRGVHAFADVVEESVRSSA